MTDPDLSPSRPRQEPPTWFAIALLLFISWVLYLLVEILIEVIR